MRISPRDELLTPPETAEYLKVTVGTLYVWRHRGQGPRGMRIGRHLRYRRRDIDDWLRDLTEPTDVPA